MKKTLITLLMLGGVSMGVTLQDSVYSAVGDSINSTTSMGSLNKSGSFSITYTINVNALFENDTFWVGSNFNNSEKTMFVSLTGASGKHVGTAIGTSSTKNGPNPAEGQTDQRGTYVKTFGIYQVAATIPTTGNYSGTTYYGGGAIADTDIWKKNGSTYETDENGFYVLNSDAVSSANAIISSISNIAVTQVHTDGSGTIMYLLMSMTDGTTREVTMDAENTGLKYTSNNSGAFGSWSNLAVNTDVVSSVYIFDSAVDANTAKALNAAAIPEPTTATLSLLALCGLAARRRRK